MSCKKILILSGFLFLAATAQSQVLITLVFGDKLNAPGLEFGLETGANWSNNRGFESNHLLRTFNLGFYFDIRMKNQWYLYTGVMAKSSLGVDKLTQSDLEFLGTPLYEEEGDYRQQFSNFLLPVLGKFKFKNHFFVEAGFMAGWLRDAYVEFRVDGDDRKARIQDYNRDLFNRIDAGLAGGFGYTLLKGTGISIGVNYYYGLVNAIKETSGSGNNSIFLKFNIPVGAAKKDNEAI
jgi:hypothetical protein